LLDAQVGIEASKALGPKLLVVRHPVGDFLEGLGGDAAGAPLGFTAAGDQTGVFEDFEVAGDGGHAHGEGRGEFSDGGLAGGEAREDGAARGIGEGGEGGTERIGSQRY